MALLDRILSVWQPGERVGQPTARFPVDLSRDALLRKTFSLLRAKWAEVPFTQYERLRTTDLGTLSDAEVLEIWARSYEGASTGPAFSVRGWYQILYKDIFRRKKVLDVGCGLAPDTVFFAEHGARVTFLDIVHTNVEFVRRAWPLMNARGERILSRSGEDFFT